MGGGGGVTLQCQGRGGDLADAEGGIALRAMARQPKRWLLVVAGTGEPNQFVMDLLVHVSDAW